MSTLQWRTLGPDDEPYWELCLSSNGYVMPFGRLYKTQDGYYAVTTGSDRAYAAAYPLGHLTLDEAKSAAKLLLMVGRKS